MLNFNLMKHNYWKLRITSSGDVIRFNYLNGHTVEEVTEEKYEACEVSILQFFLDLVRGLSNSFFEEF